jgi:3-oxoacyl-[acyl-carrier-protein] synthase II
VAQCGSQNQGFIQNLSAGFGIQAVITAFEPCEEYNTSKGLYSHLAANGFSLFGTTRRHKRFSRAGKTMAVAVEQPTIESNTKRTSVGNKRRVVVTGLGVVTPIGHDADEFYDNLLQGVSGISDIQAFDCTQFPTRIAGEIKSFSPVGWVDPKLCKRADKFMLYMLTAGKKALADAGITEEAMVEFDKAKCGVIIGSALGGMKVKFRL